MGLHGAIVVLVLIVVANIAAASPLHLQKLSTYNSVNQQQGRSSVDIGLEIHKMHVRQGIIASNSEQHGSGENDLDEASEVKRFPGLFDDTDIGETLTGQELETDDRPDKDLDLELQYHSLSLQLQKLSSSEASDSVDLENELITLEKSSGKRFQKKPKLSHTDTVLSPPTVSTTEEDLSGQLQHEGENMDAQLLNDFDITDESSGSGKSASGDGCLDDYPSLETNNNMDFSELRHPGDSLNIPKHSLLGKGSSDVVISGSGYFSALTRADDGSVYEDITLSGVPQPGSKTRKEKAFSTEQTKEQQNAEVMSELGIAEIAKVQEKKTNTDLSVDERLELELEGLSLVVGSITSVDSNQVENDASLELTTATNPDSVEVSLSRGYDIPPLISSVRTVNPNRQDIGCLGNQFTCRSGSQCLRIENVCDLVQDCEDGSDEDPFLCVSSRKCVAEFFKCGSSAQCISQANRCDGIYDCSNGEDEKDCWTCEDCNGKKHHLTVEDLCDSVKDCADGSDEIKQRCQMPCSPGYRKCKDGLQCVKEELFCNGVHSCHDMSDEVDCDRTNSDCQVFDMFACDGLCHPMAALCDSTYDCSSGIDEDGCVNDP
ncbi:uncharacterized protein LOC110986465 isoform X2 [Acanthaster planci]|uniref:Uncharacterized protein LOC110986465 isoform X2 n=1 Tax=Acanthaster planci TaxID=133434 RepID=A0A8B7ZGQ2_ACAPL|nr:uncharacterized protein LOC110986465 isoform X2 [Acanthaster planci]